MNSVQLSAEGAALQNEFATVWNRLDTVLKKRWEVKTKYEKIRVKNDAVVKEKQALEKAISQMYKELAEATKKKNVAIDLQQEIDELKETGILIQSQVDFVTAENKKKVENCVKIKKDTEEFEKTHPKDADIMRRRKEASKKNSIYQLLY